VHHGVIKAVQAQSLNNPPLGRRPTDGASFPGNL